MSTSVTASEATENSEDSTGNKPKVDKVMRPLFSEIARLSATLGMARKACYDGNPSVAVKALSLLTRQVDMAMEIAEITEASEQ